MPKRDEGDYFELQLSPLSVQAAWWVMTSTDCKHRSEARLTRKVLKALKKKAMDMKDEFHGSFKGGLVVLAYDPMQHLKKSVEKRFEGKGVEGQYAEGVDELLELIEEAELEKRAKAKSSQAPKEPAEAPTQS